jgi:hypothetical protein
MLLGTLLHLFAGLVAGTVGGLLGLGGGILLMPFLRLVVKLPPAEAAGTCVLAVLFTTLGGSFRHYRRGNVKLRPLLPVIVTGVVASTVASIAFPYLVKERVHWLDVAMGAVFLAVAAVTLWQAARAWRMSDRPEGDPAPLAGGQAAKKAAIGLVAGSLPGLLGVGTGSILVPSFTFLVKAPVKTAMASSLVCFAFTAAVSAAFKLAQGSVDLAVAAPVCVGTLLGANAGVAVNGRISSSVLRLVFGLLFVFIAGRFMILSWGA